MESFRDFLGGSQLGSVYSQYSLTAETCNHPPVYSVLIIAILLRRCLSSGLRVRARSSVFFPCLQAVYSPSPSGSCLDSSPNLLHTPPPPCVYPTIDCCVPLFVLTRLETSTCVFPIISLLLHILAPCQKYVSFFFPTSSGTPCSHISASYAGGRLGRSWS
jgi:hypothetical protein